ncbi:MAG: peptidyl-prolyl cis-trans isomerase [Fibromonadales bacterium]|nr:peptidyl-prolyl cis-trans isomerase [Fibromonadales bacterium]
MRNIFTVLAAVASYFAIFGCSQPPQEKAIAKIGNSSLYVSDAEFLASIRQETIRSKDALTAELQQVANDRRMAETARSLFAGEQNNVQQNIESGEDARLAQIYSYFYLVINMGHSNKALQDYYKKNKIRYTDTISNPVSTFISLREQIAADLFLSENPLLAAMVNDSNKTSIIDSCRRAMASSEADRLRKLYHVELVAIEPPGLEEYYKNNPDEFKTKTAYKLLSLSDADSAVLAGKIKNASKREEFAKIATEMSLVKQGHAIMDIGMFPELDAEVSKLGAKKITPILRAPDTQVYYVFYIDSIIAPQLKPLDRAKILAKAMLERDGDIPLDSSVVLATINGKAFITEKDILAEREKIHPMRRAMARRAMVLNNLIEKALYAKAAREKSLDKSFEYIAWTRRETDRAYVHVLMDSLLTYTLGIPEDTLKAAYEAEKDSLFPKSFEESKLDIAVWLSIPDISYKKEFVLNKQSYGDAPNWQSIKRTAYKNIRYMEFSNIQERVLADLQKAIPVSILDDSWGLEFTSDNLAELVSQAKSQYDARNLQKAKTLWEKARALFPNNDSLQKAIAFELANIYQELGIYGTAINEYKIITKLWPNEPDVYKAYFMQGFVLSEYEKNDSLALIAFENMLEKFPNSDLSDDAKIMVENIKSGGKVLEDLIKKIEASSEEE